MCLAAVENYDEASESMEVLNTAELTLKDILNSPVDVASQKIDQLAQKHQFDSELGLMMAKSWSTAQESTIGHEEVNRFPYERQQFCLFPFVILLHVVLSWECEIIGHG